MRTDILLSDNLDLVDLGTEWAEGESDEQHVLLLCYLNKGELKEFPFVGFGVEKRLKSVADTKRFIRDLKVELELDGYMNATVTVTDKIEDFTIEI